jgi:hypothetical protein
MTRWQRGSVELVRSSNECIGDFELTEEAFCCPDFRVRPGHFASICGIDPLFAKLNQRLRGFSAAITGFNPFHDSADCTIATQWRHRSTILHYRH